jgi:glycine hydroxymethyltransferase
MLRSCLSARFAPVGASLRAFASWPTPSLSVADPEAFKIIKAEEARQKDGITLIPSENYASTAVLQALGSCLTNKYSEGYPGARYYGGNEQIDNMERCHQLSLSVPFFIILSLSFIQSRRLCHSRAMKVFGLDASKWGVNVQTLSGSPANFAGSKKTKLYPHAAS